MSVYSAENKGRLYIGAAKVKKAYRGATRVYSSGNIVTYHVDAGITYQEEVDEGESCLQPKTFTPSKSGWAFVGWRQDTVASGTVLTSKVMGDEPVTLYAAFRQAVTVTYYNNSTSASSTSGYRYYNNGNVVNASFTLTQAALSGWTARGWSAGTAANSGIAYANGAAFTRDSDITLYGMYQQAVTLSYSGNGATGGSTAAQTGYRYYNSNGQALNATLTLRSNGFTLSGGTWKAWALGGVSGTRYAAGSVLTLSASTTMYAVWKKPVNLRATQAISWTLLDHRNQSMGIEQNGWHVTLDLRDSREVWMVSQYFAVNECDTLTSTVWSEQNAQLYVQDQNGTNMAQINELDKTVTKTLSVSGKTSIRLYLHMKSDEWHRAYSYISAFSLS